MGETEMDFATAGAMAIDKAMASSRQPEKFSAEKPPIIEPTSAEECVALEHWIACGAPEVPEYASLKQLTRHLQFLAATLPSKNLDDDAGKDRFAVYVRMLEGYTDAALIFMSKRAVQSLDWFPTPRQCLEILKQYLPPLSDRATAKHYCQAFWQARMEQFHHDLRFSVVDQAIIDAQPDQWKRIADNLGLLRWSEGRF